MKEVCLDETEEKGSVSVMEDSTIVENCSPTLAGIKTGNLFSCEYQSRREVCEFLKRTNAVLGGKGIRIVPIKYYEKRVVLYLYRPCFLCRDLNNEVAKAYMEKLGYKAENPDYCVSRLGRRMRENTLQDDFPHEVGFFLGYPPEDVLGFMQHKAKEYKCAGCWKVYGDVKNARKTFDAYTNCTKCLLERFKEGASLEQLTVKMPDAV